MSNRAELLREIQQITEQYKREVPGGRRPWPRAIRDRALALRDHGMKLKEIAEATGLSYYTVHGWTEAKRASGAFRELKALPAPSKAPAVVATTPKNATTHKAPAPKKNATVSIQTPNGYRIEGIPVTAVAALLGSLK